MRSKAVRLTKRVVATIPTPPGLHGDHVTWDSEVRGLGLRVRASGGRRWVFRYRFRGRQRFVVIGEHGQPWTADTARDRAHQLQGLVASGIDPAATREAARGVPTLEVAATRWIREHAEPHKAPASIDGDKLMLARFGIAFVDRPRGELKDLGRTRVDAVTREQVAAVIGRHKGTPIQANRLHALLSAIFNWAGRVGADNPCRGVRRYRENKRDRFLSDVELARLGKALLEVERLNEHRKPGGESPITVGAIRLLLLSGARPAELLTARLAWVDLKAMTLRIPQPKEGRPKVLRLIPESKLVIMSLPRYKDNPYLLPGHRRGQHLVNLHDAWDRIRARAGLQDVRLYDLRHTYASIVARMRESLPIIGALLGHRRPETTLRYVHLADDPLRGVAERAGRKIAAALRWKPPGA